MIHLENHDTNGISDAAFVSNSNFPRITDLIWKSSVCNKIFTLKIEPGNLERCGSRHGSP
jgi:hypothetical protein